MATFSCEFTSVRPAARVETDMEISLIALKSTCQTTVMYFCLPLMGSINGAGFLINKLVDIRRFLYATPFVYCTIRISNGGEELGAIFRSAECLNFIVFLVVVVVSSIGDGQFIRNEKCHPVRDLLILR